MPTYHKSAPSEDQDFSLFNEAVPRLGYCETSANKFGLRKPRLPLFHEIS